MTVQNVNGSLRNVVRPGEGRGLDFVRTSQLNKRTGIDHDYLNWAERELKCNSLDKNDATYIREKAERDGPYDWLTMSDNGSEKITRKTLDLIVRYESPASSKRGLLQVTRGSLGNALQCGFGLTVSRAEDKGIEPQPIFVASGPYEWTIRLKPDQILQQVTPEIEEKTRTDDGYTTFKIALPAEHDIEQQKAMLLDQITGAFLVNPTRKIDYDLYGQTGSLGTEETESQARDPETSALWYKLNPFTELFHDFQRATPNELAQNFAAMFRGFSNPRTSAQKELFELAAVLQQEAKAERKNCTSTYAQNVDCGRQFLRLTPLKDFTDHDIMILLRAMKNKTKPIASKSIPDVLGCVGPEAFERLRKQNGWLSTRKHGNYDMRKETKTECPVHFHNKDGPCEEINHVEVPYLVELAVYDRPEDGRGVQLHVCTNFMPVEKDTLNEMFNVQYRLAAAGVKLKTPITIIVHLVSPLLGPAWHNYGKTSLSNIDTFELIEKCFNKLLPEQREPYLYVPPKQLGWIPKGNFYDDEYRKKLQKFADQIKVIAQTSGFHVMPKMRGWGYRLEQLRKIDKGEFNALAHAINDCRKLKLLKIDIIRPDPDESRHFKGIHRAAQPRTILEQLRNDAKEILASLPSSITDFYRDERYYLIVLVEKSEIFDVYGPICLDYHVPHVSSKGWSNLEIRYNIAQQCRWAVEHGLQPVVLLFYDHDPKGLKISETFRHHLKEMQEATAYDPDAGEKPLIIERFGLNFDQINTYKLSWVNNLKTSSGKEPKETKDIRKYIEKFGRRKCEMESLYRDELTIQSAEQICREAIEKYYGPDAKERFREKEEESKGKLGTVYDSPLLKQFDEELTRIEKTFPEEIELEPTVTPEPEFEVQVHKVGEGYYRTVCCPKCFKNFRYEDEDIGKLVRCRECYRQLRLKLTPKEEQEEAEKRARLEQAEQEVMDLCRKCGKIETGKCRLDPIMRENCIEIHKMRGTLQRGS